MDSFIEETTWFTLYNTDNGQKMPDYYLMKIKSNSVQSFTAHRYFINNTSTTLTTMDIHVTMNVIDFMGFTT